MSEIRVRIRQVKPGVWVPDQSGPVVVTWQSGETPHPGGCRCGRCLVLAAGACIARHAHCEVVRAGVRAALSRLTAGNHAPVPVQIRLLPSVPGSWQAPVMIFPYGQPQPVPHEDALSCACAPCQAGREQVAQAIIARMAGCAGHAHSVTDPGRLPGGNLMLPGAQEAAMAENSRETTAKARKAGLSPEAAEAKIRESARCRRAAGPRLTPEEKIIQVLAEPAGLDSSELDALAPYGTAAPGFCTDCLLVKAKPGGLRCGYCARAEELRVAARPVTPAAVTGDGRYGTWSCTCAHKSRRAHERSLAGTSRLRSPGLAVALCILASVFSFYAAVTVMDVMTLPALAFLILAASMSRKWS